MSTSCSSVSLTTMTCVRNLPERIYVGYKPWGHDFSGATYLGRFNVGHPNAPQRFPNCMHCSVCVRKRYACEYSRAASYFYLSLGYLSQLSCGARGKRTATTRGVSFPHSSSAHRVKGGGCYGLVSLRETPQTCWKAACKNGVANTTKSMRK